MKRRVLLSLGLIGFAVWAMVQAPAPGPGLAAFMPQGPLLFVEAQDFGALVRDWNASREKTLWLASSNYSVFQQSRLYQRLTDAQNEFAAAAGLPPDMALVESVAGSESALAIYDTGNLHFLYITKLASARALETALWKTRSSHETRNAAGIPYFLRVDPASRRVAAFASAQDYLLLATREDLIAGALTLLAGRPAAALTGERWYAEGVRAAGTRGEVRMVMNMPSLLRTPYFRSYWIQRNVSALRQFDSGVADLHRSVDEYREDRVFLRLERPGEQMAGGGAPVSGILKLVPPGVGFYSAWANPGAQAVLSLLRAKILAPGPGVPPLSENAPGVVVSGVAGTEADLETRIDEPPLGSAAPEPVPAAVRRLIEANPAAAALEVAGTRVAPGGVFVAIDTAIVLVGARDWDANAVHAAFANIPEAGPPGRLAFETSGKVLIVSNSADLAGKILSARESAAPAAPADPCYSATFAHKDEHARFVKMMRLIDHVQTPAGGMENAPPFFSGNIASLSTTLARADSVEVVSRDTGPEVFETVTYRLKQ